MVSSVRLSCQARRSSAVTAAAVQWVACRSALTDIAHAVITAGTAEGGEVEGELPMPDMSNLEEISKVC